jgi:hypothetical protein
VARLRRTGYSIRRAVPADIDALVAIEKANWVGPYGICSFCPNSLC